MAKEIVINVSLEAQGVVENIQKIETELDNLRKQREAIVQSGLGVEALTSALNSVDNEIKQLEGTYDKLISSTNSYAQAQKNVATEVENAAISQAKIERQIKGAEGVTKTLAGSVNLATSAFAIFGVENEQVAASLLKVQAAAAFSTGIKDLTEGFKALNLSGLALNKTLLANPFVLIATLVSAVVLTFVDFDDIVKLLTSTVSFALAPLEDLFSLFGEDTADEIDKVKEALDEYNQSVATSSVNARLRKAEQEQDIARLKLFGKTEEDLSLQRRKLITDDIKAAGEQLDAASEALNKIRRDSKSTAKQILDAENLYTEARANQIAADTALDNFDAETKKKQKEREETAAKERKSRNDTKKAEDDRIAKELLNTTLKNISERIKAEEALLREQGAKELEILKQKLLEGNLTQELFDAERLLLEIDVNNKVIESKKAFNVTDAELEIIKAEEQKKFLTQVAQERINIERKNTDIRLAILNKVNEDTKKAEVEGAKDRISVIEKDFLVKKQELLDIAAKDEKFTQEKLNIELLKLEIGKNENLLGLLKKGSQEYLTLETQIAEQRLKLEKDTNEQITKDREKSQKDLLDVVTKTVEGIGKIVQDVSPLFESVGQTALQTFADITTQIPELLTKFQDELATDEEKIAAGLGFVASSLGAINSIVQDAADERITKLDEEEAARIASLERQKEAGLISEEQLAAGRTRIEADFNKKKREAQKKAFEAEKAIRITQAIIQTAEAALSSFSSGAKLGGPIVGGIFAGIATAFGLAQVALIASQKFPGESGGSSGTGIPSPSIPSTSAQGSITPTTFQPNVFGTGAQQEQTFGQSTNQTTGGNVLRAYVVESDIASTSNRLNTIRTTSEL